MGGTPEPDARADAPGATAPPSPDPWIGRILDGRYRVTGLIGAGGMGSVYRVEHVAMGKAMAIKVLHPRLGPSSDAGARFQREAFVGGKIGHPNCVAVSDFGTLEDGSFFLVMELLAGESLGDLLDRHERLPWRRALHIARHVLRGLGHAHEHGVVHRDIKPDNIFVARTDDDPDFAKILDFGIAKLVGEGGTTITQAGITVGTPAYLSPEQAFGGELDGRSDLYSLSVVLYEMVAGRTPFGDRDLMAMLTAHAVAEPPPIAEVAPDAQVPPAVEALIRAGLAKTQADRIGSAAEYVARIDDLLGRTGVPSGVHAIATPTPFPTPGSAPTSSLGIAVPRPWRKIVLGVAGAIIAVGAIAALASRGGGGHPDQPAPAPAVAAPEPKPEPKRPEPKPEPKKPEPKDAAGPATVLSTAADTQYKAAIHDLEKGKTCPIRKEAVARLASLGDQRAIPALKKARYRMRGGLLGIGSKNSNNCLKADAEAAIKLLSGL